MDGPIDPIHFKDLSARDPAGVCRRALCRYDMAARKYTVTVWGEDVHIFPHEQKIESEDAGHRHESGYFHLFTLHYLLRAKAVEIAGHWISETAADSFQICYTPPRIAERTDGR